MEIEEELRALYTAEEIETIISCFTGYKTTFSYVQLRKRVETVFAGTILDTRLNEIIADLYRLGFLGNYLPAAKAYRWQHKGDDKVILSDEWRLTVHRALRGSLSLGSRTDYGLGKHDEPQVGDVVEVTVKHVGTSFVKVDFIKGVNQYEGAIHISQIADHYIPNLRSVVSVDDVFCAVILEYDEKHKNWRLSKRKYSPEEGSVTH